MEHRRGWGFAMSAVWLKQALVGVEGKVAVAAEGAIGALLTQIVASESEAALGFARAAGAMAACRRAAIMLAPQLSDGTEPASADTRALSASHPWFDALTSTLIDGPLRLQFEACVRVAAIDATLPHKLLPHALEAGKRNTILRDPLQRVLGHRGRWLAQFNPEWKFAASGACDVTAATDPKLWEEGTLSQRVAYLQFVRNENPAEARDLLQAQLGELPAKERIELVGVLAQGLTQQDESLLAPLLKDRSRDVRVIAARLLARLPESAHAKRLIEWMTPLLTEKRGLLKRSWLLEAPAAADPEWQTAAIDATRPQHDALGERAWWLYQLVRQIPLSWWTTRTGMSATDLIAWAKKTDWQDALFRGWREQVGTTDRDWVEALLSSGVKQFVNDAAALLALLPIADREKYWPRTLAEIHKAGTLATIAGSCALGETLSANFSRSLIASVHDCFVSDAMRNEYGLRAHALEIAAIVHDGSLAGWQPLPRRDDETPGLAECIHEFERIVAIRRTLHSS
jgi:hypothetical protein